MGVRVSVWLDVCVEVFVCGFILALFVVNSPIWGLNVNMKVVYKLEKVCVQEVKSCTFGSCSLCSVLCFIYNFVLGDWMHFGFFFSVSFTAVIHSFIASFT